MFQRAGEWVRNIKRAIACSCSSSQDYNSLPSLTYFLLFKNYSCFSCDHKIKNKLKKHQITVDTTSSFFLARIRRQTEQEQRKSHGHSLRLRTKTRHGCIMHRNTAEQPLRRHVRASTLTTLLTLHINGHHALNLAAPHSRSKHQDHHLLRQASMMDELCNSGLNNTLSSPQHRGANDCDTLQLLLSWWPYRNPAVTSLMSLADIYTCELHSELSPHVFFFLCVIFGVFFTCYKYTSNYHFQSCRGCSPLVLVQKSTHSASAVS